MKVTRSESVVVRITYPELRQMIGEKFPELAGVEFKMALTSIGIKLNHENGELECRYTKIVGEENQ